MRQISAPCKPLFTMMVISLLLIVNVASAQGKAEREKRDVNYGMLALNMCSGYINLGDKDAINHPDAVIGANQPDILDKRLMNVWLIKLTKKVRTDQQSSNRFG